MAKQNGATNGHHDLPTSVDLNGLERLLLLQVLPPEGSLLSIRIAHELRQALALSEDETAILGVHDGQPIGFEMLQRIQAKPIPIGRVGRELITAGLRKLDESQKVGEHHLPLFDKFPIEETKGEES